MLSTLVAANAASAFDHHYGDYGALLQANVRWSQSGNASAVDYASLKRQQAALETVLHAFSSVGSDEFVNWTREQQIAFLINAYNGFTLELILSRYPALKSIRDLGSLLSSPWKKSFFSLLGSQRTLDWIEHDRLRPAYRDERVHFAVNCASIGCPALRPEPYVAEHLDSQLDDQQRRFLTDRSRNRLNAGSGQLAISSIFKWYGEDFDRDGRGLQGWLSRHASLLADEPAGRARIASGNFQIDFLSYDWTLNEIGAKP